MNKRPDCLNCDDQGIILWLMPWHWLRCKGLADCKGPGQHLQPGGYEMTVWCHCAAGQREQRGWEDWRSRDGEPVPMRHRPPVFARLFGQLPSEARPPIRRGVCRERPSAVSVCGPCLLAAPPTSPGAAPFLQEAAS